MLTALSLSVALLAVITFVAGTTRSVVADPGVTPPGAIGSPQFDVDASWPKELPNNWIIGQVGGLSVDKQNHIWVYQRPATDTVDELAAAQTPQSEQCCYPAPPVLEFNANGDLLNAWGPVENALCPTAGATCALPPGVAPNQFPGGNVFGPALVYGVTSNVPAPNTPAGWTFPATPHGIVADDKGNVWVGGNGGADTQLLKFDQNGHFKFQIGRPGQPLNNLDAVDVGHPSMPFIDYTNDKPDGDLYLSDGYGNSRIMVFDAVTGAFRRAWGAFGVTCANMAVGVQSPTPCTTSAGAGVPGSVHTTGYGTNSTASGPFQAVYGYGVNPSGGYIPPLQTLYAGAAYCGGSTGSACVGTPNPSYYARSPIHCIAKDPNTGNIWACDRTNNRLQVFTSAGKYLGQCYFAQATLGNTGSVWDLKFYPKTGGKNEEILAVDGSNNLVREILPNPDPSSGTTSGAQYCKQTGQFGHQGRNAGYFHWAHVGDFDSAGNYYIGEVDTGKRVQKFVPHGGFKLPDPDKHDK